MRDGEYYYIFQQHDYGYILNKHKIYNGSTKNAQELSTEIRKICLEIKKGFLSEDGKLVNYEELKKSTIWANLREKITELQKADLSSLDIDERKAFFLNIYNCLILHGFLGIF